MTIASSGLKVGDKIRVVWEVPGDPAAGIDVACTVTQLLPGDCVKATVDDASHRLHESQGGPHELFVAAGHYEAV